MATMTGGQLTVYACPPEQVTAVLRQIEEYGLLDNETVGGDAEAFDGTTLLLNHPYTAGEVRCGVANEIAEALAADAGGAVWEVWEDPKYEWLGEYHARTPTLGGFAAACDADGQILFTAAEVRSLLTRAARGEDVAPDLGEPWRRVFAEMSAEMPDDYPAPAMRCRECSDETGQLVDGMCIDCASFAALAREVPAL